MGSLGWEVAAALRWPVKGGPETKATIAAVEGSRQDSRCGRKWGTRHRCCGVQ